MLKHTKEEGDKNCRHNWVTRNKKTFQILERACVDCARVEYHSEGKITPAEAKRLMEE